MGKYYAVKIGKVPGIYKSWAECEIQVKGYKGAQYKSFTDEKEAYQYLGKQLPIQSEVKKVTKDKKNKSLNMKLTKDQEVAYQLMIKGDNVFVTGEAGTGKSFVINKFVDEMQKNDKNILICAPTGIAALQIGGVTIHRCFHASLEPQIPKEIKQVPQTVKQADIIIIDEISMCRMDLFEYVARVIIKAEKITKKKKQVIVVGDFYQLPPVTVPSDRKVLEEFYSQYDRGFAFEAESWKAFDFKVTNLVEVMRQNDSEFIKQLNRLRVGDQTSIEYFNAHASVHKLKQGITLCGMNRQADKINKDELEKLQSEEKIFKAIVKGEVKSSDKPTEDQLRLKLGARVIVLINDTELNLYQNGSLGEVVGFSKDGVDVKIDNTKNIINFTYQEWAIENYILVQEEYNGIQYQKLEKEKIGSFKQIPLKLAYAITIHKSQGQTYDQVNLIPHCFDCGQLYVALSRVKSIDGLCLLNKIKDNYLICDPKVQVFYEDYNQKILSKDDILIELAQQIISLDSGIIKKCPIEIQSFINKTLKKLQKIQ